MLRRGLLVLAVVGAAVGVGLYYGLSSSTRAAAPWPPAPSPKGAPVSLERPFISFAGTAGDEVALNPQCNQWGAVGSVNFRHRYFWLRCDLHGAHCAAIPGLVGRTVIPPQGLELYTIRGAFTATNKHGSTTVDSGNFYWVHAGIPLDRRGLPQYDPDQLRAWYGLRPEQNGAGQTIVVTGFGLHPELRMEVDHFSKHYGLPLVCRTWNDRACFRLAELVVRRGKGLRDSADDEAELDVEWAHAIAPQARIVVVESEHPLPLVDEIRALATGNVAHVFSSSWCTPCYSGGSHDALARLIYGHIARGCHVAHVVCTWVSGDGENPGVSPSNSPYVLSVGGTKFKSRADGEAVKEVVWPSSGYGETDTPLPRPSWQRGVRCGRGAGGFACNYRAIPDVSATADGATTFAPAKDGSGWFVQNGTSLSAPLWAALIALSDQELQAQHQPPIGIDELHQVLYRGYVAAGLDDIPPHGWDWKTGWGSPKAGIVDVLVRAIERYRAASRH